MCRRGLCVSEGSVLVGGGTTFFEMLLEFLIG